MAINFKRTLGILALIAITPYASAANCVRNTDGEILDSNFSGGNSCTVTPDSVTFPVYKFGLCEEVPTYENYLSTCTFLIDRSSAQDVVVSSTSNISLTSNLTLSEASYPASVLLLGNGIGVTHADIFDNSRTGLEDTGNGYANSEGNYCSTRLDDGSEDDFESNLDCDTSEITAGQFTETVGAYHDPSNTCTISGGETVRSGSLSFNTASGDVVICGMSDEETLETYSGDDSTNATRQLVIQTFNTPVVISANTKTLDIAFKVTDMLSIEENDSGYTQAYLDGIETQVKVE